MCSKIQDAVSNIRSWGYKITYFVVTVVQISVFYIKICVLTNSICM